MKKVQRLARLGRMAGLECDLHSRVSESENAGGVSVCFGVELRGGEVCFLERC